MRHAPMVMLTARGGPRRPTRGAHQARGARKTRGARWRGCAHRAAAIAMVAMVALVTLPVLAARLTRPSARLTRPSGPGRPPVRRGGGRGPFRRAGSAARGRRHRGVVSDPGERRDRRGTRFRRRCHGPRPNRIGDHRPGLHDGRGPARLPAAAPARHLYRLPHRRARERPRRRGRGNRRRARRHRPGGPGDPRRPGTRIRGLPQRHQRQRLGGQRDPVRRPSRRRGDQHVARRRHTDAGRASRHRRRHRPWGGRRRGRGNDATSGSGFTPYSYPASFPGVISVAAVGADGRRASFSDRNASVVLSAPGVNVVGAAPGGSYLEGSGTSPASAIVAGVAALIRSRYPRLSPVQVELAMISSASRRPAGGYSPDLGFGEVNAPAALTAAARLAAAAPQTGLAAGAHFGPAPGPIQVVHRDEARIDGYGVAGAVLALVGVALLAWLIVRVRRCRSSRRAVNATLLSKNHPRLRAGQPGCVTAVCGALAGRACLAWTLTRPLSQARGNAPRSLDSSRTTLLSAVIRTSAGGSPGAASCTGSAPCGPNRVTKVTFRSVTWQENERPLKKASRSFGSSSESARQLHKCLTAFLGRRHRGLTLRIVGTVAFNAEVSAGGADNEAGA